MTYTYIKRSQYGKYLTFNEPLSPDEYNNLGTTWDDFLDDKWVLLSDEQVAFHEEYPEASVQEVWNMQLTPPHVRTLEEAKSEMIQKIDEYDSSDSVNSFLVNDTIKAWFTADERANYRNSIDSAETLGVEELTFFIGGMLTTVPTANAKTMLATVQLYADQCYIVTQLHKDTVNGFETIEAVDSFDYKSGYPEMPSFIIEDAVVNEETPSEE
jgi:hypothetical protein